MVVRSTLEREAFKKRPGNTRGKEPRSGRIYESSITIGLRRRSRLADFSARRKLLFPFEASVYSISRHSLPYCLQAGPPSPLPFFLAAALNVFIEPRREQVFH